MKKLLAALLLLPAFTALAWYPSWKDVTNFYGTSPLSASNLLADASSPGSGGLNANALTNGSPGLATNNNTAVNGQALVKRGNNLSLETIVGGGGNATNAQPSSETLSNLADQVSTPLNLDGGTNFNGANIQPHTLGTNSWDSVSYLWVATHTGSNGNNGLNGTSGTNGQSGFFGIATQVKPSFSTNYTVTTNDTVLFCSGTNQFITLSGVLSAVGKYASVYPVNATASVIVTNSSGVTIMGAVSQAVTNGQHITLISDGSNWW